MTRKMMRKIRMMLPVSILLIEVVEKLRALWCNRYCAQLMCYSSLSRQRIVVTLCNVILLPNNVSLG